MADGSYIGSFWVLLDRNLGLHGCKHLQITNHFCSSSLLLLLLSWLLYLLFSFFSLLPTLISSSSSWAFYPIVHCHYPIAIMSIYMTITIYRYSHGNNIHLWANRKYGKYCSKNIAHSSTYITLGLVVWSISARLAGRTFFNLNFYKSHRGLANSNVHQTIAGFTFREEIYCFTFRLYYKMQNLK